MLSDYFYCGVLAGCVDVRVCQNGPEKILPLLLPPLAVSTAAVTITIVALSMPLLLPFSMAHKYWFIIAVTPDISINEYDGCTLPS